MIPDEHLPLFITEELFLVKEQNTKPVAQLNETRVSSTSAKDELPLPAAELKSDIIVVCDRCNASERDLLTKILSAVNVDIDEVLLIEGSPQQTMVYQRLLVFGDLDIEEAGTEPYIADKANKWLRSKSLATLAQSKDDKMKLWGALKRWFSLN